MNLNFRNQNSESAERAPKLVLRFALYTGVVLAAAGLAILWSVDREVASRAERTVEANSRVVAADNLRRYLRPSDFSGPVSKRRRAELDDLFLRKILVPGVVGARLFNASGMITYAARHELIGKRVSYPSDLRDVFAGHSKRRFTRTVTWHGVANVKVLQALIPVQRSTSARPIGALELDQDYRAVQVGTGNARMRLALILAIAFLILYLSLFPILRRLTGQLQSRNQTLHEQAAEREELLEGERTARAESESIQRLLTEQNERLRELDRMKDEFVSLVSHELRTPLTSIRGYLELLLEDENELTAEQQRFLGIVDRNSRRLLDLVGDLLFLAQVDAGKLAIESEEVDLEQLVHDCIDASHPLAESRRIDLVTRTTPLPGLIGDRARLAQVLDNLVSNALKFTSAGGRVTVELQADEDRAVLEVSDTGVGIPAAEQSQLFDRFFRSSRATEGAIPGTGLGLAITKTIVERHGGRISLESTEGEGTSVRVELPLETAGARQVPPQTLAA